MKHISAQVSLYPLRRSSIGQALERAIAAYGSHGVDATVGPMSTLLVGGEGEVFRALQAGFHAACQGGDAVMVVTVSNACPVTP